MAEEHLDGVRYFSKIKALFEYREIPRYIEIAGIEDPNFIERLYRLQCSIYDLDHYLETVWDLEDERIAHYWDLMKKELESMVSNVSSIDQYLYQISVYLKREQALRRASFSLTGSLTYFYYYKSCDVRLMRRLIYEHSHQNKTRLKPSNWYLYDLVTEVNDDVEDLLEDMGIFNCNRFLYSTLEHGVGKSTSAFKSFLNEIKVKNKVSKVDAAIRSVTAEAIADTLQLIDQRMEHLQALSKDDVKVIQMFSS